MKKKAEQNHIAVIGAGRFGLFWGRHLSAHNPVWFFDSDAGVRDRLNETERWDSLENCLRKDYIFLTIPIRRLAGFLRQHTSKFSPASVIIDCASVKQPVVRWFEKYLPKEVYYCASHPLFGPDSAQKGLAGHVMTLIPGRIPFHRYKFLVDLFERRMHLTILNMSVGEHDWLMAYNLSLMHHIGRAFNEMKIARVPLMMANLQRINQITRVIMHDSEELFSDFYRYNPHAGRVRDHFLESFSKTTPRRKGAGD